VIDLSYALALDLGVVGPGTARVRVTAIEGPGGSAPPPRALQGPLAWQVGAFTVQANASSLARSLEPQFGDVTVEAYDRGDTVFHRVRVGSYSGTTEAHRAGPALRARGLHPLLVRRD
jgi:rare lipoprotein A